MKKGSAVTVYDVARKARVSVATVSRVLNPASQSGPVSEQTRVRVLKAVGDLGYVPRIAGNQPARRRTHVIGLVVPDISNPFFAEMAQGVIRHACDRGFEVIIAVSTNEFDGPMRQNERGAARTLVRRRVDGIIAVPIGDEESVRVWKSVLTHNLPVVFVDRDMNSAFPDVDAVTIDDKVAVRLAMKLLFLHGHERIGILTGPLSASTLLDRLDGYKEAFREAGKPYDASLVANCTFEGGSRHQAARALLTLPNRPTAIFAPSNLLGESVLFAAQELRLTIPRDVSLVMFDDVRWARLTTPPLTTISHDPRDIGAAGVDLLVQRMNTAGSRETQRLVLPTAELRLRGSIQEREAAPADASQRA